ncbi:MAG: S-layer homology domain-containing protein [Anaerotignum sp.]|nr:S-layer homology domain-containing protein [Anaerotignum sp.]
MNHISVGENTNILSYNDAFEISEYAIPAMQWACGAGIIRGNDDGTLNPAGHA